MVICPLCRGEHLLPDNGLFPSDRKCVELFVIRNMRKRERKEENKRSGSRFTKEMFELKRKEEDKGSESRFKKLLECAICLQRLKIPKMLPCQHTFCENCLQNLVVNR